jgi:hypothetical protein
LTQKMAVMGYLKTAPKLTIALFNRLPLFYSTSHERFLSHMQHLINTITLTPSPILPNATGLKNAMPTQRTGIELNPLQADQLSKHLLEGVHHSITPKARQIIPPYRYNNYTLESIQGVFNTIRRIPEGTLRLIKSQYYPKKGEFHPAGIRLAFNRSDGDYTHQIHQDIRQSRKEIAKQFSLRHSNNPLLDKGTLTYDDEVYDSTRAFYPLEKRITQQFIYPHLCDKYIRQDKTP